MIKKDRISVVNMPLTKVEMPPLPSVNEVNDSVGKLTGKKTEKTETEKVSKKRESGRPVKKEAVGRVKFTTMLPKPMVKWLKTKAVEYEITTADFLIEIVDERMKAKKSKTI